MNAQSSIRHVVSASKDDAYIVVNSNCKVIVKQADCQRLRVGVLSNFI
jgi:hypothetical protein